MLRGKVVERNEKCRESLKTNTTGGGPCLLKSAAAGAHRTATGKTCQDNFLSLRSFSISFSIQRPQPPKAGDPDTVLYPVSLLRHISCAVRQKPAHAISLGKFNDSDSRALQGSHDYHTARMNEHSSRTTRPRRGQIRASCDICSHHDSITGSFVLPFPLVTPLSPSHTRALTSMHSDSNILYIGTFTIGL